MAYQGFLPQQSDFATNAIHPPGLLAEDCTTSMVQPIVLASHFKLAEASLQNGFFYGRCGNPTRFALEHTLAVLEGGNRAFTFSSGHGAWTAIFALCSAGDHILCCDEVYAGTTKILRNVISRMGIEVTFEDFTKVENVPKYLKKNTKLVWLESPSNPTMKIIDLAAVSKIIKSYDKDIMIGIDNTFLTSYFQKPFNFGIDIVMYSLTKYMNGHCDVVMGAAIVKDDKIAKRLASLQIVLGIVPSPMDCYLVIRSLKTLSLRMERHKESSFIIAKWLLTHENISEVLHPGLPSHPQHELAKRQCSGHAGAFSFKHSGGLKESQIFLGALKMFTLAVSLGGYDSLAALPATMIVKYHLNLTEEQRVEIGITDSLIRVSIGFENPEDLIKDLDQALKTAFP